MSSTGLFKEKSNNLEAEQMTYADDDEPMSVLRRLEKQFQDIMLAVNQVWGPRMVEMEGRIMKIELAVDKRLASMKSNNEHSTNNFRQRCLKLQFINNISSPIRSGDKIKGEGGNYIEVVLVDGTGKVVDFGPEASAEVKIVAFKGDVDDSEGGATKIGYFTDDIGRDRKAKKSILAGDVLLKLHKGIGILANVKLRNSSSHVSGVFKLGAQIVDRFDGTVVEDAKTSFMVKDYRGKYNEKHYPPSLSDDIRHLDNIGRVGSKRLRGQRINTVEDFLIQLLKDTDQLKRVVGLPARKWEATVKHALKCQPDEKVYYSIDSEESNGVVFNVVGEVLGLIQERKYVPLNKLSNKARADASKVEIAKIVQKQGLVPSDNEAALLQQFSQPITPLHPSSSNFIGGTSANFFDFGDNFFALMDGLRETDQYHDQQDMYLESLWDDSDAYRTANMNNMLVESPDVSDYKVRKNLCCLFTVAKWMLKLERMTACDGKDNQKRRRIGTE